MPKQEPAGPPPNGTTNATNAVEMLGPWNLPQHMVDRSAIGPRPFPFGAEDGFQLLGAREIRERYKDEPRRLDRPPKEFSDIDWIHIPLRALCDEWATKYYLKHHGKVSIVCEAMVVEFTADTYDEYWQGVLKAWNDAREKWKKSGDACVDEWKSKSEADLRDHVRSALPGMVLDTMARIHRDHDVPAEFCANNCEKPEYCELRHAISDEVWHDTSVADDLYILPIFQSEDNWGGPGNQVLHVYGWVHLHFDVEFAITLSCDCVTGEGVNNPK